MISLHKPFFRHRLYVSEAPYILIYTFLQVSCFVKKFLLLETVLMNIECPKASCQSLSFECTVVKWGSHLIQWPCL